MVVTWSFESKRPPGASVEHRQPENPRALQLAQEFDRRWKRARELTEVRAIGI